MADGNPLRIGMIGAGWVAPNHLRAWQALAGEAIVVAVADPCVDRAAQMCKNYRIPGCYRSAEEMLAAGGVDAVDIVASRSAHADLVRLAVARGKDVICQKPLARTLAEAQRLMCDVSGSIRLMVHENWRFRAYYQEAAGWIRQGLVGDVKAASMTVLTSGTLPGETGLSPALERQPLMRSEKRMLVAEVLIHHLDTLRMLMGPMTVRAAVLGRVCKEIAGEDDAVLHLETAGGAGVSVFGSFAAHGEPEETRDQLVILGTDGAIRLDGTELTLSGKRRERMSFRHDDVYQGSYTAALAHFVQSLRTGAPFETSDVDNLQTLELVEECYRLSNWDDLEREAA